MVDLEGLEDLFYDKIFELSGIQVLKSRYIGAFKSEDLENTRIMYKIEGYTPPSEGTYFREYDKEKDMIIRTEKMSTQLNMSITLYNINNDLDGSKVLNKVHDFFRDHYKLMKYLKGKGNPLLVITEITGIKDRTSILNHEWEERRGFDVKINVEENLVNEIETIEKIKEMKVIGGNRGRS